jgi:hypothetical protein
MAAIFDEVVGTVEPSQATETTTEERPPTTPKAVEAEKIRQELGRLEKRAARLRAD